MKLVGSRSWLWSLLALCTLILPALALPAAASAAARRPALVRSEVLRVLHAAQESAKGAPTGEHLTIAGKVVTVPDGFGGTLTAVPAVRFPTADGYGQIVLFWHDGTLIGSDRLAKLPQLGEESPQLKIVAFGKGYVTVRFARYRSQDPMYKPSLPPADVTYRWTGHALTASASVPEGSGNRLVMRLGDLGVTRSAIVAVTQAAQERSSQAATGEHLQVYGKVVSVPDGFGGTLTAVSVVRFPTADGYGQLVLFWHDQRFLGSDRLSMLPNLGEESSQLAIVGSGPGFVTVRFQRYRSTDPMYNPSLAPADVTYRWSGTGLTASAPVPAASGNGLGMRVGP